MAHLVDLQTFIHSEFIAVHQEYTEKRDETISSKQEFSLRMVLICFSAYYSPLDILHSITNRSIYHSEENYEFLNRSFLRQRNVSQRLVQHFVRRPEHDYHSVRR